MTFVLYTFDTPLYPALQILKEGCGPGFHL